MKNIILILSGLVLLSACSKSKSSSHGTGVTVSTMENVTDYSVCSSSSRQATSLRKTWKMYYSSSSGIKSVMQVKFTGDKMIIASKCQYNSAQISTYSETQVRMGGRSSFRTLNHLHDYADGSDGRQKFSCGFNLKASNFVYSFQGQCLKLLDVESGNELVLVPETRGNARR